MLLAGLLQLLLDGDQEKRNRDVLGFVLLPLELFRARTEGKRELLCLLNWRRKRPRMLFFLRWGKEEQSRARERLEVAWKKGSGLESCASYTACSVQE
jgi:hypothetical protein